MNHEPSVIHIACTSLLFPLYSPEGFRSPLDLVSILSLHPMANTIGCVKRSCLSPF